MNHHTMVIEKLRAFADALERGEGFLDRHSILFGRHREYLTYSVNIISAIGTASFEFNDEYADRWPKTPPTIDEMVNAATQRTHNFIDRIAKRHAEEFRREGEALQMDHWFAGVKIEFGDHVFVDSIDWLCVSPREEPKEKPGILSRAFRAFDELLFRSPI